VSSSFADGDVVLRGLEPGTSTITFTWGTATLDFTADATAPAM
jgi:hypothetical protein